MDMQLCCELYSVDALINFMAPLLWLVGLCILVSGLYQRGEGTGDSTGVVNSLGNYRIPNFYHFRGDSP